MKERKEELLNKYIDNELDSTGLNELNELLDGDDNAVKELKAMKIVEQSLRKLEFEKAPENSTYSIMTKIAATKKSKRSNGYFWFVMGIMILCIAASLVYAFHSYQPEKSSIIAGQTADTIKNFVGDQTKSIDSILKGFDKKLISTILTLLFSVTGYFIFETHKNFRNKLKGLQN